MNAEQANDKDKETANAKHGTSWIENIFMWVLGILFLPLFAIAFVIFMKGVGWCLSLFSFLIVCTHLPALAAVLTYMCLGLFRPSKQLRLAISIAIFAFCVCLAVRREVIRFRERGGIIANMDEYTLFLGPCY